MISPSAKGRKDGSNMVCMYNLHCVDQFLVI